MGFEILPPVQNDTWKYTMEHADLAALRADVRRLIEAARNVSEALLRLPAVIEAVERHLECACKRDEVNDDNRD